MCDEHLKSSKAPNGLTRVGKRRFRENPGLDYEDFRVGDVIEHWPGRTINESDNTWFTLLTMNTHPLHFDAHYSSHTEFGKCLINSTLTVAIVVGMCVSSTSQRAIANLGWQEIRLPAPVFAGDTVYAETTVMEKRLSKSRTDSGIVKVGHVGRNQRGEVVVDMVRSFLAPTRGHSTAEDMRKS